MQIPILCVDKQSNYFKCPDADCYDAARDMHTYSGSSPVICHPPCRNFVKVRINVKFSQGELDIARRCYDLVQLYGGIIEQPKWSIMFDWLGIKPTLCIDQSWFGLNYSKQTWLYFKDVKPLRFPLSLDLPQKQQKSITSSMRSRQPLGLCHWLIDCCKSYSQGKDLYQSYRYNVVNVAGLIQ